MPVDMTPYRIKDAHRAAYERKRQERGHQANLNWMKQITAVQWRTRITAVERKLVESRMYLRHMPQNETLRAEVEQLEAMYKELRGGPA